MEHPPLPHEARQVHYRLLRAAKSVTLPIVLCQAIADSSQRPEEPCEPTTGAGLSASPVRETPFVCLVHERQGAASGAASMAFVDLCSSPEPTLTKGKSF